MLGATRAGARLTLAALLVAGAACSSGDATGADRPRPDAAEEAEPAGPPFAVGRRELTLVDPSRTTMAVPARGLAEQPSRTIPVIVLYPAAGEAGPEPEGEAVAGALEADADAPPAEGTWPLVVFAHGWSGRAETFSGFAALWARHGYVVALPTFPLSRDGIAVSDDLPQQPGDVSFVVDSLADLGGDDPLAGHVDTETLAVGGHSLGSATVFGVAYNSCCLDERIDATIPVSGGPLGYPGGTYDDRPPTPMLLVHGAADPGVPVAAGDAAFDLAVGPVWYLRPTEADHVGVFLGEPGRLFGDAVVAFLDAELKGEPAGLDAMADEVAASGAAEWRVKPGA